MSRTRLATVATVVTAAVARRRVRRIRLEGVAAEEAGGLDDHHDEGAAGRAAHRPARPGRRGAGAPGRVHQGRQRQQVRPAADRDRRCRHRLGRGGRGRGDPLPRDVPVAGSRRRGAGALGASHRSADRVAGGRGVRATRVVRGTRSTASTRRRCVRVDESAAGDAMFRDSSRQAPHNLYAKPALLFTKGGTPVPPPPLFEYAVEARDRRAPPRAAVHIGFSGEFAPTYTWDAASGTWKRSTQAGPFLVKSGTQVAPKNVVVCRSSTRDGAGRDRRRGPARRQRHGAGLHERAVDDRHVDAARQGPADEARRREGHADPADAREPPGWSSPTRATRSPSRRPDGSLRWCDPAAVGSGRSGAARLRSFLAPARSHAGSRRLPNSIRAEDRRGCPVASER